MAVAGESHPPHGASPGRDEVRGQNPRILNSGRQSKEYYGQMWRDLIAITLANLLSFTIGELLIRVGLLG